MALEGTLKTPIGPVPKKTAAWVGVGAAAILGIVWYRTKNAAATATNQTSTDINPQTGYPYGSPEDIAALQQMGVGVSNVGANYQTGNVIGYDQYGNPIYSGGGGGGYPAPNSGPGTFTNNAQWSQYAEQYMVDTAGADAATVGNALGKYITGQAVTADQRAIIQQAIAFAGFPPLPGPNGNPPGILDVVTPPPPPPPPGGGGGGSTGWYWHQSGRYFTFNGAKKKHPSGTVKIGGKTYYYHSVKNYFSVNGKRVAYPPSGIVT